MQVSPNTPVKESVVAGKTLEDAGLDPQQAVFAFPQPFNESFFDRDTVVAAGLDLHGLVKQLNQVFLENLRNNLASRVRSAVKNKTSLPTADDLNQLVAAYDFSGVRTTTSEDSMTALEKIQWKIARRELRKLFRRGVFEIPELGIDFDTSVTIAKENEEPEKEKNQISFDEFEARVEVLIEGEREPWAGEPEFDASGAPLNGAAIRDTILREAQEEYQRSLDKTSIVTNNLRLSVG